MNLLTGLWAGAKAVLGFSGASKGSENVMKVATGIGSWIDEQKFTPEEQAKHNLTMVGLYGDFMKSTVAENTQRSITRRAIAIWVIRLEAIFLLLYGVLASFKLAVSEVWWKIAVDSPWGMLTLGVGAFFFGTHMIRSFTDKPRADS
jgi:hypothetical protein